MKYRLPIFSGMLLGIFTFLQVQTLFIDYTAMPLVSTGEQVEKKCAKKKKSSCARSKCMLPEPAEEEDCNNNGCNPFVPCAIGICCYLVETIYTIDPAYCINNRKLMLFDDNRLSSALSECWHPPELLI